MYDFFTDYTLTPYEAFLFVIFLDFSTEYGVVTTLLLGSGRPNEKFTL